MSWVDFTWSLIAATCLMLGAFHAIVGFRLKAAANLWFALSGISAAGTAVCELMAMRAGTPERWGAAIRWDHLALLPLVVSVIGFVRTRFRAGRRWLGWAAAAARGACVVVNFAKPPNLNWSSVVAVRPISFWFGERVSVPVGTVSPWTRLGQVATILLVAFLLDAARTVWRRAERREAVICTGIVAFVLAASLQPAAIHAGLIHYPYLVSFAYLAVVATMSYDITRDVVRVSELKGRLRHSEADLADAQVLALRATSEALAAQERFRLVVEAAPSGMILVDARGTIELVNAQTEALFGYRRDELVGLPIETLVPERLRGPHGKDRAEFLGRAAPRAMGARADLFARRKDGSEFPAEIGLSPVRSADGTHVLASVTDVSERRRTALELEQQRNEVAHLSRLTLLGEIAGSLAHELSQPLTSMLANAQAAQRILRRDPPDITEIEAILADIVDENRHAGEVISRLRAMLRKGERERETLDLSEVVHDVLRLARSDLLSHHVGAETEIGSLVPPIDADRVLLLQVLLNVIVNGCDAMADTDPEGRRLVLRAEGRDGQVHLSISDRGPGIPPEDLERIFEPFVTTKRHGMGLGLAVCRTIVAEHGGRIWATNNDGRGATFHLTFPAATGHGRSRESPGVDRDGTRS